MKRLIYVILIGIFIFAALLFLNMDVTTKQCIDYKCCVNKIPLYLKTLDFLNRHYNYVQLLKGIIKGAKTDEDKVMAIFIWTYTNIKRVPEGLPVIDDHIWYTIVRGYGASDQFQDIFTTLCNHAGINAFFTKVFRKNRTGQICLSFVKLEDRWAVFDAYNGVYFNDKEGRISNIKDLVKRDYKLISLRDDLAVENYGEYFDYLDYINYQDYAFSRPSIQSPIRRFLFWLRPKNHKSFF